MAEMTHAINWFEIPVLDMDRARMFYETIFGYKMRERAVGATRMAFFDSDAEEDGRGGALVYDPAFYTPSANGALVYLNCEDQLEQILARVGAAGGEVLQSMQPVSLTQDMGYWALMRDPEGNRVALHGI